MKRLTLKLQQFKAFFIAFVISRFAPDYENIKKENENLKQDIYSLIEEENTINGITTKTRWKMRFDMDKVIMFGDATKKSDAFSGILSQISYD